MTFKNVYKMDMNRYRKWMNPPLTKVKGFWFWAPLSLLALAALLYFRAKAYPLRLQSLSSLILLAALYRGFFFRRMYVDKQFRIMCMDYGYEPFVGWQNTIVVDDEGIRTFMDEKPMANVTWDQVQNLTIARGYFDLEVDMDFIRLDKASFVEGNTESFLAYMTEKHSDIEQKAEKDDYSTDPREENQEK